mgnify:CR=1 FL=1
MKILNNKRALFGKEPFLKRKPRERNKNWRETSERKMNKKGGKILSIYWFAILAIVAVGIIAMVVVFYGKPYDIRKFEAEIMINNAADCFYDGKTIRKDIDNTNFLKGCNFNLGEKNEFYLEIDSLGIKQGNSELKDYCGKGENIVCVEKNIYYLDENNQGKTIKILSIINKE